jgi:chemotaxis protein methyltransferase CheR
MQYVIGHSGEQSEDADLDQGMLLREMQHRIANSLQIVASILSLKARMVESEDARLHLMDAYNRVMSIAAVQRQLLASRRSGMIRIDDYLADLSERLATSLTEKACLSVVVEGTATIESNKAVAIGLVMTELIINALKHAFPNEQDGRISVTYKTAGPDWSFSVLDNGVGLSSTHGGYSGYGTRIVDALAKELDAQVSVKSGSTGTLVSLIHSTHANPEVSAADRRVKTNWFAGG